MSVDPTTHSDSHHSHERGAPNPECAREVTAGTRRPPTRAEVSPAERVRLRETERAILRARVVALERALERRERRLASVVEQYERILDSRAEHEPRLAGVTDAAAPATDDGDDTGREDGEDAEASLVARLRSLVGL